MRRSSKSISSARSIGLLVLLATVHLGCSQNSSFLKGGTGTSANQAAQMSASTSGGNGDYYGGKPSPGIYHRFDANSVIESLKVTEKSAELLKVEPATGKLSVVQVRLGDIEYAEYLPGRVGIGNGLYTKKSISMAEGVSEAWCRKPGSNAQSGYDVVVEKSAVDRSYRAKFSETVFAKGVSLGERTSLVERVSQDRDSGDRVRYRADGFELEIRFDTFNSVSGKFSGRLRFDQDREVDTAIDCRVGGALENQIPVR